MPTQKIGNYLLIATMESEKRIQRVFLDTNVAIDIERFYYAGGNRQFGLEKLLLNFPVPKGITSPYGFTDINYGFAVAEACTSRTAGFDLAKAHKMSYAISKIISWSDKEVERNFANSHPAANRDKFLKKNVARVSSDLETDLHSLIAPTYAYMLYLQNLVATRKRWKNSPVKEGEKFVAWAQKDITLIPTYEAAIILGYLSGSQTHLDMVHKLLKTNPSDNPDISADKAWNAAWDIFFVRMTDGSSLGLMGSEYPAANTVLATRNIDPELIKQIANICGTFQSNAKYPLMTLNIEDGKNNIGAELEKIFQPIMTTTLLRVHRPEDQIWASIRGALSKLESQKGVSIPLSI